MQYSQNVQTVQAVKDAGGQLAQPVAAHAQRPQVRQVGERLVQQLGDVVVIEFPASCVE